MSAASSLVYHPVVGRLGLAPIARWGYRRHLRAGDTPDAAYRAMRKLYGCRDQRPFDALVAGSLGEHPLLDLPPASEATLAALRDEGYVVLPTRLDEAACADIEAVALAATATLVEPFGDASQARFDPAAPLAVRYDLAEGDVLQCAAAQQILADESLLAIAQAYLGAAPIVDLVAMWWSAAGPAGPSDAAAQAFHFDLDRLRFLKLFVYLTDVDERHGPHVYVRGSHRAKPPELRHDGRHRDDAVQAAFAGDEVVLTGERGTMFLADTLGLHKGLAVAEGHRLVFQIEWASSLFGAPFERPTVSAPTAPLTEAATAHPWAYQRFELGGS